MAIVCCFLGAFCLGIIWRNSVKFVLSVVCGHSGSARLASRSTTDGRHVLKCLHPVGLPGFAERSVCAGDPLSAQGAATLPRPSLLVPTEPQIPEVRPGPSQVPLRHVWGPAQVHVSIYS